MIDTGIVYFEIDFEDVVNNEINIAAHSTTTHKNVTSLSNVIKY